MPRASPLDSFIDEIRAGVAAQAPELLETFGVFAQEARFGYEWLRPHLSRLAPGAHILEVGAGLLLLSCQLQRDGFKVTAVEPLAIGFSDFTQLQAIVIASEAFQRHSPELFRAPVEQFNAAANFDLAFSVNVMEHVGDVKAAISRVMNALRPGASYAFTCPNYAFPYEPHFSLPTLFSKSLTERFLGKQIFGSRRVSDPRGVWLSLNWITVSQVRRICRGIPSIRCEFNRGMLVDTFSRAMNDPDFARRRSPWVMLLVRSTVALRLHVLLRLIPAKMQPIMDCRLTRNEPGSSGFTPAA